MVFVGLGDEVMRVNGDAVVGLTYCIEIFIVILVSSSIVDDLFPINLW
jgi:hypothetical protein